MDSKKTNLKKIGNEKFEKKDYKGAIEDSSKVIELDPHNKDALFQRSIAYQQLSDLDLNNI